MSLGELDWTNTLFSRLSSGGMRHAEHSSVDEAGSSRRYIGTSDSLKLPDAHIKDRNCVGTPSSLDHRHKS